MSRPHADRPDGPAEPPPTPWAMPDPSRADTDLEATTRGAISLTPLTVDLTHDPVLAALKAALA